MHHYQKVTNSKKFITNIRSQCKIPDSVAIQHDITEACQFEHNREIQSHHFGVHVSVSIQQGFSVLHYPNPEDELKTMFDFHIF